MKHLKHTHLRLFIAFIILVLSSTISFADSVKTINNERQIVSWKTMACACNDSVKSYWYVFRKDKVI